MRQSILHVALVVKDYDEAIDFYCSKLNFTLVDDTCQAAHEACQLPGDNELNR